MHADNADEYMRNDYLRRRQVNLTLREQRKNS